MLKGNKNVPVGFHVSNITFIIIKRTIYLKSTLAKKNLVIKAARTLIILQV